MSRIARFVSALVAALGGFTFLMYVIGLGVLESWVARDLTSRSQLAVAAGHESLISHWQGGHPTDVASALNALALQDRILGAAACDLEGRASRSVCQIVGRAVVADVNVMTGATASRTVVRTESGHEIVPAPQGIWRLRRRGPSLRAAGEARCRCQPVVFERQRGTASR